MGKQVFDGPRKQHFYADPFRVCVVGLLGKEGDGPQDTPHTGKDSHPLWDERVNLPVDMDLSRNISAYGVLETVKVRKRGQYPAGHDLEGQDIIEVIDGRQRTRSCRVAAKDAKAAGEVPPLLKIEFMKISDDVASGVMISTNEQRRDDLPSAKARKAARVLGFGHSVADVALMFGVSKVTIGQWTKFGELDPKVTAMVDAGALSFSAAVQLHPLNPTEQVTKAKELTASGPPTVAATKAKVAGAVPTPTKRTILTKGQLRKLTADGSFLAEHPVARALLQVMGGDREAVGDVPGLNAFLEGREL